MEDFRKNGYYFEAYHRVYALHKKHSHITEDSQWRAFVDDLVKLEGKYAQAMGVVVAAELERLYAEDKKIAVQLKNDNTHSKGEQIMLNI